MVEASPLFEKLDEKAQTALKTLAPDKATKMMEDLEAKGDGVRNPSAWVCKAVGNSAMGAGSADDLLAPYKENNEMDEKAIEALSGLGRSSVEYILKNFEEKKADLRNASAWVVRAVANHVQEGKGPDKGGWGGKGGFGGKGGYDDGWVWLKILAQVK